MLALVLTLALGSDAGRPETGAPDAGVARAPVKKSAKDAALEGILGKPPVGPAQLEPANLGNISVGPGIGARANPSCGASITPYAQQLKMSAHVEVQVLSPGPRDRAEVQRFLQARLSRLRACYERVLKRNPLVRGRVELDVTLTPVGAASAVELVLNQTGEDDLAQCTKAMLRQLVGYPKAPMAGHLLLGVTFWGDG